MVTVELLKGAAQLLLCRYQCSNCAIGCYIAGCSNFAVYIISLRILWVTHNETSELLSVEVKKIRDKS